MLVDLRRRRRAAQSRDPDRQDRLGRRARSRDRRVPARVPHGLRQHDHGLDASRAGRSSIRARFRAPTDVDSGKVFEICPHIHGARNLQAPSFSPLTGYYYLGVNNSCMNAQVVTPVFRPGQGLTGVTYTASLAPGYDYVGEFVAFDPDHGRARVDVSAGERRADDGVGARDGGRPRVRRHRGPAVLRAALGDRRAAVADALERRRLRRARELHARAASSTSPSRRAAARRRRRRSAGSSASTCRRARA